MKKIAFIVLLLLVLFTGLELNNRSLAYFPECQSDCDNPDSARGGGGR